MLHPDFRNRIGNNHKGPSSNVCSLCYHAWGGGGGQRSFSKRTFIDNRYAVFVALSTFCGCCMAINQANIF